MLQRWITQEVIELRFKLITFRVFHHEMTSDLTIVRSGMSLRPGQGRAGLYPVSSHSAYHQAYIIDICLEILHNDYQSYGQLF